MKLILLICVIYGIPRIEGIPVNYEQILEPRGITDSLFSWWYGEPEDDENETISQDDLQDTTLQEVNKSQNQYTESIPNESGKRVIPVNKTPKRKVEPIEDLLKELNEEIKQSSDNEEKKEILNTLTEIKSNLQEAPSRFVNVMVNKVWRLVDIGNINSSRRTRSIESIGMLTVLIQWLLSILSMNIFSLYGGESNTSHEALIPKWFTSNNGVPVNVQSSSVIGLPGDKNGKNLDLEKLSGDQNILIAFLKKDKTGDNKDKMDYDIKGDTQDEKINNIDELLKKKDLSNKTKQLILVELYKMYDDDLDNETKKRIIYLILVICDDPEFKEVLEVLGKSVDPEYKKVWNFFVMERNSLKKKYDDIQSSTSKDKDTETDPISKKNNKTSTEYHIITLDQNMKLKPRKEIDEGKFKDLVNGSNKSHTSKDHATDVKQSVLKTHEGKNEISQDSPSSLSAASSAKVTTDPLSQKEQPNKFEKTAETLPGKTKISQNSPSAASPAKVTTDPLSQKEQPNKSEKVNDSPHIISRMEKHDYGNEDPSIQKYNSDIPDHSENNNDNKDVLSSHGDVLGKSNIAENHDHVAPSSPRHDSNKSIENLDESLNESPKPSISKNRVQSPTTHESRSHHNENLEESHNNKSSPPYVKNHDHFPIQDPLPSENTYYEQNQSPHDTLPFDGKVEEHPSIQNPSLPDIKNYQYPLPLNDHSPPTNEPLPYNEEDHNTLTAHKPPLFDADIGNQNDPTDDQLSTDKSYHDSVNSREEDNLNEHTISHDPFTNDIEDNHPSTPQPLQSVTQENLTADEDQNTRSDHNSFPFNVESEGQEDLADQNLTNEPYNTNTDSYESPSVLLPFPISDHNTLPTNSKGENYRSPLSPSANKSHPLNEESYNTLPSQEPLFLGSDIENQNHPTVCVDTHDPLHSGNADYNSSLASLIPSTLNHEINSTQKTLPTNAEDDLRVLSTHEPQPNNVGSNERTVIHDPITSANEDDHPSTLQPFPPPTQENLATANEDYNKLSNHNSYPFPVESEGQEDPVDQNLTNEPDNADTDNYESPPALLPFPISNHNTLPQSSEGQNQLCPNEPENYLSPSTSKSLSPSANKSHLYNDEDHNHNTLPTHEPLLFDANIENQNDSTDHVFTNDIPNVTNGDHKTSPAPLIPPISKHEILPIHKTTPIVGENDKLSTQEQFVNSVGSNDEHSRNEHTVIYDLFNNDIEDDNPTTTHSPLPLTLENHSRADEDHNHLPNHESLPSTGENDGQEDPANENFNNAPCNTGVNKYNSASTPLPLPISNHDTFHTNFENHNQLYPNERIPHDIVSKDDNDLNEQPTTDNETLQNPFNPPKYEYDPHDQDDYIHHPHSQYNSHPENRDDLLGDEENPSNNLENYYTSIPTYYPYDETSDRVKFYYDPEEKTYKDMNSTTELDDIFEKMLSIIKHDHIIPKKVQSKIVQDLVDMNIFLEKLKDDTEDKFMRTLQEVGKNPKFTIFKDFKEILKLNPSEYLINVLRLFGQLPGDVQGISQANPEIVNNQRQSTPHDPYAKSFSMTHTHSTESYRCPQAFQSINSMEPSKNLRKKIEFYIEAQNGLNRLNTNRNQEAYTIFKKGVDEELQKPQYDNLRKEFLDNVPSQNILEQLKKLKQYLIDNKKYGMNDQEEKDAIREYLSKPH